MSSNRVVAALEQVKQWMRSHGAPLLVENLAPGASAQQLAEAERKFGFSLPEDVKALWSLHHGQREELNGFVGFRDLLDTARSLDEVDTVLPAAESLREKPEDWPKAGISKEEIESDRWVPFAGRDSDLIVASGVSGRVFACEKDWPPLQLLAGSVAEWAEQYAARVVADDYAVEDGFGDYYLELRDREAERQEEKRQKARDEAEKYRRETPLLDQLREGLKRKDAERCREVLDDVASREPGKLAEAVEVLFSSTSDRKLVAGALQYVLRAVTLTPAQWKVVAEGGKALGNEAIAGIAVERGGTAKEAAKPWWKFW